MPDITTTAAPAANARPATLAEFLEKFPLPWKLCRIDGMGGPKWEIEAANGQLVPNHDGMFCVEEHAKVFAELGSEVGRLREARPLDDWHEDVGRVLWWRFPVEEPHYSGTPMDCEWPGYHTHWTPIVVPPTPEAPMR